jgi:thiosulfate/3-mercaptopyruvate sulfurtransferase
MPFETLIDTRTLETRLEDRSLAIVDCRFDLNDTSMGERGYLEGHIPGAVYAHLDRDLSGEKTGTNGRHPLPPVDAVKKTFARFGIDSGVQVVAYDQDTGMYASRLWWMLRWLGHQAVAVLDGGFAKWIAEGRPVKSGSESREPRRFTGSAHGEILATIGDVADASGSPEWKLIDARAPERFRGESETIDKAAGHIPGAVDWFYKSNLDPKGVFLPPDTLRTQLSQVVGATPIDRVVCYCGSGVTACHNLLALEHAGLHGAKLYAGSWSEWSSDPKRPVETGN